MKTYVIYGLTFLFISGLVPHSTSQSLPSLEDLIEEHGLKDAISPEILDEVKQKSAEREANPELYFANSLKVVEKIDPSLAGISDTWQNDETAEFLKVLITGLANYYEISDEEKKTFYASILRLTTFIPNKQHKFLSSKLESFSKSIVRHLEITHGFVLSSQNEEKTLLIDLKEEILAKNSKTDVREIDQYLSCLNEIDQTERKGMSKYLSQFIKSLEKYSLKIEELSDTELKHSNEIKLCVRNIFDTQSPSLADLKKDLFNESDCTIDVEEFL